MANFGLINIYSTKPNISRRNSSVVIGGGREMVQMSLVVEKLYYV